MSCLDEANLNRFKSSFVVSLANLSNPLLLFTLETALLAEAVEEKKWFEELVASVHGLVTKTSVLRQGKSLLEP